MVDREDFSKANFTLPKKWDKKKPRQQETVSESIIHKLRRINNGGY